MPAHKPRYILGRDDLQSPATGTPFQYYGILSKDRNDNIIDSYTDVGVDQAHLLLSAGVVTRQDLLFSGALPLTPPPPTQPTQQLFTQFLRRLLLRLLATKRNRKQWVYTAEEILSLWLTLPLPLTTAVFLSRANQHRHRRLITADHYYFIV